MALPAVQGKTSEGRHPVPGRAGRFRSRGEEDHRQGELDPRRRVGSVSGAHAVDGRTGGASQQQVGPAVRCAHGAEVKRCLRKPMSTRCLVSWNGSGGGGPNFTSPPGGPTRGDAPATPGAPLRGGIDAKTRWPVGN